MQGMLYAHGHLADMGHVREVIVCAPPKLARVGVQTPY